MRSKEVENAIDFVKFYKEHCLNIENSNIENYETINDEEFIYKNLETVLNYISEKEKENEYEKELRLKYERRYDLLKEGSISKHKIRDKIKELEDLLELHQTYTIEEDICSKLEVLKSIIGE